MEYHIETIQSHLVSLLEDNKEYILESEEPLVSVEHFVEQFIPEEYEEMKYFLENNKHLSQTEGAITYDVYEKVYWGLSQNLHGKGEQWLLSINTRVV